MADQVSSVERRRSVHPVPLGWADDPLGFLVAPITRDEFFRDYYEQKPLLSARNEPLRYADMLTLEALDAFVDSADLRDGMIDLASQQNRIDRSILFDGDGRARTTVFAEEYLKGSTLIFPHLHESMAELGEFCRALESVFSSHAQTNIYLTPQVRDPGSRNQGFPIHYDNHDVFVLQISGSKAWNFYGEPVKIPYRGEAFQPGRHDPGEVTESFTLKPGDCVYVPRGLMHEAPNVGEEPSLHITVGLITKTWADLVLEAVSELALEEPSFRRSLPPGFARRDFDREKADSYFSQLTAMIAERARLDNALDLMADTFLRERRPKLAGVIAATPDVPKSGDRYRCRPLVPWQLADDDAGPVLIGPGGDLAFQAEEGDALERALSGELFGVDDLVSPDAAGMIRKLWAGGYLERIAGD
jgi:bifunctional lysine-specific demethylase and histidyl-hydroxylase NO66